MKTLLRKIRDRVDDLPLPADPAELLGIEALLGASLPASMLELYRDHGGMLDDSGLQMRLMSPSEVMDAHNNIVLGGAFEIPLHSGLFWIDRFENDFAGLYMSGDLQGFIYILDHSETDCSPQYRSIESFYDHLLTFEGNGESGWWDMPRDFPRGNETSAGDSDRELELAREHLSAYNSDPHAAAAKKHAFNACKLIPSGHLDEIIPLLKSTNMHIQERAAETFGQHCYAPVAKQLYNVVLYGTHNGTLASILALKKIDNSESREMLAELRKTIDSDWDIYFR